jgi:hypothetical protein
VFKLALLCWFDVDLPSCVVHDADRVLGGDTNQQIVDDSANGYLPAVFNVGMHQSTAAVTFIASDCNEIGRIDAWCIEGQKGLHRGNDELQAPKDLKILLRGSCDLQIKAVVYGHPKFTTGWWFWDGG